MSEAPKLPVVAYADFAESGNIRIWSSNMSDANLLAVCKQLGHAPVALCKYTDAQ